MHRRRITRRRWLSRVAAGVAAAPFVNLGSYRLFRAVLGENFRRVLGEIWVS